MKKKLLVFLAGAYKGNRQNNYRVQAVIHMNMMADSIVLPFSPLVTGHAIVSMYPMSEEVWEAFDKQMLHHCDALYRYDKGDGSKGADAEEQYMKLLDKPIFYNLNELYRWAESQAVYCPKYHDFGIDYNRYNSCHQCPSKIHLKCAKYYKNTI